MIEQLLRAAERKLVLVYAHYRDDEIRSANPTSQLGRWRDGIGALHEALSLVVSSASALIPIPPSQSKSEASLSTLRSGLRRLLQELETNVACTAESMRWSALDDHRGEETMAVLDTIIPELKRLLEESNASQPPESEAVLSGGEPLGGGHQ
jgi:hypothetical protein